MTRTLLIAHLAEKTGITKKLAAEIVGHMLEGIVATVKKGDAVSLQGFGTFKANKREARIGVNPRDPQKKINIPAMRVVSFKAGSEFKKSVR